MRSIPWILSVILITGCTTGKSLSEKWQQHRNDFATWKLPANYLEIESHSDANIYCDGKDTVIVFRAPYDIYYPKPPGIHFRNAFKAVYYNDFFDRIYLDPKVKPLFRDSVHIMEVLPYTKGETEGMYDCPACDYIAQLKFNNAIFYYPVRLGDQIAREKEKYLFNPGGADSYEFRERQNTLPAGKILETASGTRGIIIHGPGRLEFEKVQSVLKSFSPVP